MVSNRCTLALTLLIASLSVACGTGAVTSIRNQPAPTSLSDSVSIAFKMPPPTSIFVSGSASLTAVVSNDPLNAGVDWTLAPCGNTDCGSISAPHTASGQAVQYSPPASLPKNSLSVKVLAFATADRSKNLTAPIAINGFSNILKGTYVFQTSGVDIDPLTGIQDVAQSAGVVVLDGNSGVVTGEQTYTNTSRTVSDAITGGSYFVGPDGRGTLTLLTADPNVGESGVETFDIVILSSSQVFILKNDPVNANPSNESTTGTMDLQTSITPPSKGYAFVVTGTDLASTLSLGGTSPTGIGGILNIDSPNTISGIGSVIDEDLPAIPKLKRNGMLSGTVSQPDALGAVQFNLTTSLSTTPLQFAGYIVDASHIKLIETDVNAVNSTGAATSGIAIGQGAATGTFTNKKTFAGNYVFGVVGQDAGAITVGTQIPSSLTSAGTFTAGLTGTITSGFNEAYFGDLFVNLSDQFQSTCKLGTAGTGRMECPITYTVNGPGPDFIFYQTGNGNPLLLLDADSNALSGIGVGAGFGYLVSTLPTFNGDYGVRLTQTNVGSEADFSGQIAVNAASQTLAGTLDVNTFFVNPGPTVLSGTLVSNASPNILSGTLTNVDQYLVPNGLGVSANVDYYFIDSNHGFFLETDLNDPTYQGSAVTFGYFGRRTRLCQSCP